MTEREPPDEHRGWMRDETDADPPRGTGVGGPGEAPLQGDTWPPATASSAHKHSAPPPAEAVFPWPPPEDESIVAAFARTWQGATFEPARFFRALPDVSIGASLLYYLPLGILVAGADLFWETVVRPGGEHDTILGTLTGSETAVDPLVSFLMSPFILLLSLFISAAVTHALLKLFGGAARGFACTVAVFAFCYSPMLFGVIPVVGVVIGFVWAVIVTIIGVREAQRTTGGRAAAAVLIPIAIALFMMMVVLLVAAAGNLLDVPI